MTQKGTQKRKIPRGGELAAGAKNGYGLAHLHVERQTGAQVDCSTTTQVECSSTTTTTHHFYYVLSAVVFLKSVLIRVKECFRDTLKLRDKWAKTATCYANDADRRAMIKSSHKWVQPQLGKS